MKKDIKEELKRKLKELFLFESQDFDFGIYRIMSKAEFVISNEVLSVSKIDGEIKKVIIKDDLVYKIVATLPNLFYTIPLSASLWFLKKTKLEHIKRKVLFKALGIEK